MNELEAEGVVQEYTQQPLTLYKFAAEHFASVRTPDEGAVRLIEDIERDMRLEFWETEGYPRGRPRRPRAERGRFLPDNDARREHILSSSAWPVFPASDTAVLVNRTKHQLVRA